MKWQKRSLETCFRVIQHHPRRVLNIPVSFTLGVNGFINPTWCCFTLRLVRSNSALRRHWDNCGSSGFNSRTNEQQISAWNVNVCWGFDVGWTFYVFSTPAKEGVSSLTGISKYHGITEDKQSSCLVKARVMICIGSQKCNFVIVQMCPSTCHPSQDELWQAPSITSTRQTNSEWFTSQWGFKMSLCHILDMMHCYWNIKEITHFPLSNSKDL